MATIAIKQRRLFFNDPSIERYLTRVAKKSMRRFGAMTRQDMKKSIKRKAPTRLQMSKTHLTDPRKRRRALRSVAKRRAARSKPGQPPFSHVRNDKAGLRNIQFKFVVDTKTVVVGPIYFHGTKAAEPVPGVLEHGGRSPMRRKKRRGKFRPGQLRKSVRVRKRPFSKPAGTRILKKFPKLLKDAAQKVRKP